MFRRPTLVRVLIVSLLALGVFGCGSSKSSSSSSAAPQASSSGTSTSASSASTSSTHLAKTKFVLHAGLAFGTFHRWIYKPLKQGLLAHPLQHKVAIVKAGLAGAFVIHEVKLALTDAQSSPTLRKLVAPLTALQSKLSAATASIKGGHPDASSVDSANSVISMVHSGSAAAGRPIAETSQSF
jgi:hypothetical protein